MIPPLDNDAFLEDNDLIRMAHRAQPVSNDDAGTMLHHIVDGILHQLFALRIQG